MIEDLDMNALGITAVITLIVGWMLIADPMDMGMERVSLWGRIIGIGVGAVVSYLIAARMIDN